MDWLDDFSHQKITSEVVKIVARSSKKIRKIDLKFKPVLRFLPEGTLIQEKDFK